MFDRAIGRPHHRAPAPSMRPSPVATARWLTRHPSSNPFGAVFSGYWIQPAKWSRPGVLRGVYNPRHHDWTHPAAAVEDKRV